MISDSKLERVIDRLAAIEAELSGGQTANFVKLSKEHAELAPIVSAIRAYKETGSQLAESEAMAEDPSGGAELRDLAYEEVRTLTEKHEELEHQLKLLLLPKDSADSSSAIVEVRG